MTTTNRPYAICARCVMDTTDVEIQFDGDGICNHCHAFAQMAPRFLWSEERSRRELPLLIERIRADGRRREYDCVIGVSGGVDSTYVAYAAAELKLRALPVHLDNGWDSALAVSNIKRTMDRLGFDLFTEVLDWDEFRDLQLAFLKASTPDSEVPTDHAILAVLLHQARQRGIKHIFFGGNFASEGILPKSWSQGGRDWTYIRGVHARFGTGPLRSFPHLSVPESILLQTGVLGPRWLRWLDYIQYNKTQAMDRLKSELGWEYYGGKHHESVYTRFFQSYILPVKFNIDKRKAHLSSLINAGELSRKQALKALEAPICPPEVIHEDREYVKKKFGLSEDEFEAIMALPRRTIRDYPHFENGPAWRFLSAVQKKLSPSRAEKK